MDCFTVVYYIKYSALYGFRALIKLIISHVGLFMIISHVKIIASQTITNHAFWTFYIGGKPVVYISTFTRYWTNFKECQRKH